MTDVEILMKNGCTKTEAEKHLKNGKQMIEGKKILPDWGIVKDAGKVYYIAYCL